MPWEITMKPAFQASNMQIWRDFDMCICFALDTRMADTYRHITGDFTGQWSEEQRLVQATMVVEW